MEIQLSKTSTRAFRIHAEFEELLHVNSIEDAAALYAQHSQPVKNLLKERGTSRVFLKNPCGGSPVECYLKRYEPVPLKERIKCRLALKPVFTAGALHEWKALCAFHRENLATLTPIAAGSWDRKTCNLTLGLTDYVRASELFRNELPDDPQRRQAIIQKIADYAARMHRAGLAHQDFYLVHFFVKPQENDALYLIDLQRVILRNPLPKRWIIKDLAQISFALAPFLTREEVRLFRETYETIHPLPCRIWRAVDKKAIRIRNRKIKSKN